MALVGLMIVWIKKRKAGLCTERTKGVYIKYRYNGNGVFFPIVEYTVGEKNYSVRRRFRGIKTKSVTGLPNTITADAWEDEKGWLNVKRGSFVSYKALAEKLWPIGSEATVFYDPKKPGRSFVERPVTVSFTSILCMCMGAGYFALGILLYFLLRYAP